MRRRSSVYLAIRNELYYHSITLVQHSPRLWNAMAWDVPWNEIPSILKSHLAQYRYPDT